MNTISKIARSNNRKNKTRSVLIRISIFLSTVLLSTIGTYAYGMLKTQNVNAAYNYGTWHGRFLFLDAPQLQKVQRRSEIVKIGISADAGMFAVSGAKASFIMTDQNTRDLAAEGTAPQLESGSFPEGENEIAAQKQFFAAAGYEDAAAGDVISLDYRRDL